MEKGIIVILLNAGQNVLVRVYHPKLEDVAEIPVSSVDAAALLAAVKQGLAGRVIGGGWELTGVV